MEEAPAITHRSDDPETDALIGELLDDLSQYADVRDGGYGSDIVVETGTTPKEGAYAKVNLRVTIGPQWPMDCVIRLPDVVKGDRGVVLHELLHCLGVEHSDEPDSLMACGFCYDAIQPDDIAALAALYPRALPQSYPYHVIVPMLSK